MLAVQIEIMMLVLLARILALKLLGGNEYVRPDLQM